MKLSHAFVAACVIATGLVAQEAKPKVDAPKPVTPVAKPETPATPAEPAKVERQMGLAKPITFEKDNEVYGAAPKLKDATKLADVVKTPKNFEGKTIQVTGTIDSVCQKKGCWMQVKDGDTMTRVKFTGYKFFVPLDVAGRNVTVEGVAETTIVTEAMRRHYAQDAGKSKEEIEKIKGDETSVSLMVDAVKIGAKAAAPLKKETCCEGDVDKDGNVKKPEADAKKPATEVKKPEVNGAEKTPAPKAGESKSGVTEKKAGGCCGTGGCTGCGKEG